MTRAGLNRIVANYGRVGVLAAGALTLSGGFWLTACSGEPESEEHRLVTSMQAVQFDYVGSSEGSTTTGANLLTTSSTGRRAGRATGAIRANWSDGAKGECGATFISPHYAITAAHCVASKLDMAHGSVPIQTPFTVSQYNLTNFQVSSLYPQSLVEGDWPNYTRPNQVGPAQGYIETNHTGCTIARRCSTVYGPTISCPFAANADIAMIRCANRPKTSSNWVNIAGSDTGLQNIDVWWFHEILYLLTNTETNYVPYQPDWNDDHYYVFLSMQQRNENFHYRHNQTHQLFPLISKHSATNVQYKATGVWGDTTDTTASGCHGSSGSGVFVAGQDVLLGPVSTGGSWASTQLCSNMDTGTTKGLAYVNHAYTKQFQDLPEVVADRL